MSQKLEGGRINIYKKDNCVYRPAQAHTKYVHLFLRYLHSKGFDKVPFPYGIDYDNIEKISFVEGEVFNELLPDNVKSDETLVSFCKLMKQFHTLGEQYVKNLTGEEKWMLEVNTPVETMCHGDLAPYNVVIKDGQAAAFIDFDTLHPGPRIWDIAYSLYRWTPMMSQDNPESFGTEEDKRRRFNLFIDTYGLNEMDSREIVSYVVKRLEYLINFMKTEAKNGNTTFQEHIQQGHVNTYLRDIDYIKKNWG